MSVLSSRRAFLAASSAAGASVALGCSKADRGQPASLAGSNALGAAVTTDAGGEVDVEVTPTEDLMREHGVMRRALVVYREAAVRLRAKPSSLPPDALQKTANLFRSFGEDYHERKLEEVHIFPVVKRAGGAAARDVDTLILQHNRGREITDYVLGAAGSAFGAARAEPLARSLEAFARMYEEHAAIEDTVVFPAWKKVMSAKQLEEMGELFEEIEHETFGRDGFEGAVDRIAAIESVLGLALADFTAPSPPIP